MKTKIITLTLTIMLMLSLGARANEPPDALSWRVDGTTLYVSGQGAIPDYSNPDDAPWSAERAKITKIVVEEGITRIGNLAFYGFTNATEAVLPDSAESIGVAAFSYTEGMKTSIGELNPEYLFALESDHAVVSQGDEFILTINLTADFKDVNGIQTTLIYDRSKIAIEEDWEEEEWINSIDDNNIGYISKPISGFVANNLRLMYVSLSGTKIDEYSPLYTMGKTTLPIAKIKCKALTDIDDINPSCFVIKDSVVAVDRDKTITKGACSENQLTVTTRLPIHGLVIKSTNATVSGSSEKAEKPADEKTEEAEKQTQVVVKVNGNTVSADSQPYKAENGTFILPLRHTAEAMGAVVSWNNETKIAFVWFGDEMNAVQIGQNKIFKNSGETELDAIVDIKDSRTMVSADFFEKALGAKVEIADNTVAITK